MLFKSYLNETTINVSDTYNLLFFIFSKLVLASLRSGSLFKLPFAPFNKFVNSSKN